MVRKLILVLLVLTAAVVNTKGTTNCKRVRRFLDKCRKAGYEIGNCVVGTGTLSKRQKRKCSNGEEKLKKYCGAYQCELKAQVPKECVNKEVDAKGANYRGTKRTTKDGHVCQKWSSVSPNDHSMTPDKYPDGGLGDHNYCRNPDGEPGPWCYNSEGTDPRWQLCGVPTCE